MVSFMGFFKNPSLKAFRPWGFLSPRKAFGIWFLAIAFFHCVKFFLQLVKSAWKRTAVELFSKCDASSGTE